MDPLAIASHKGPDAEGYVSLHDRVRLHFELYKPALRSSSSNSSKSPLLMVMGAFATKVHFAEMARHLSDTSGHEVCIYDHRGVGRSSTPQLEAQTAAQLAADAVVVADTLWGASTPIHVYGASMGGMVAQELALLLLPQHRLLSLALSITCRGMMPMYGLLSPVFKPKVLKNVFELWFWDSKPNLVRRLMRLLLTRQLKESMHPCGETYGQVYYRTWLEHFDQLWTFNDHSAGACHAHVCLHHYLTDKQIATIRDSGVPIVCQVSTHDNLIPAAMQFELADQLRARTVTIPTGHMGFLPWKDRYYNMLLEQLAMGEAVKGVKAAERERKSKAAAGQAAAGAGGLMASLTKPLFRAFSSSSVLIPLVMPFSRASSAPASPESRPGLQDADQGQQQSRDVTYDVVDMSVVLDDVTGEDAAITKASAADWAEICSADVAAVADAIKPV